jgi:hypothetical protein
VNGIVRANKFHPTCRGIGDGMQAKRGPGATREVPAVIAGTDQLAARERKGWADWDGGEARSTDEAGNSGRGKGPRLKADARSDDGKGDWR